MPAAVVLYEDSRGPQPRDGFGPHRLALACVADETGIDRWELRSAIVDNVRNGNSKVIKACREQSEALAAGGATVVAVLDNDRVREALSLDETACKRDVIAALATGVASAENLAVVLLERNTEDLIAAAADALGRPFDRPIPKRINLRDSLLNAAAVEDRGVRDRIRAASPSFDRLVRALAEAWHRRNPAG